jgi:hypothetical protein
MPISPDAWKHSNSKSSRSALILEDILQAKAGFRLLFFSSTGV